MIWTRIEALPQKVLIFESTREMQERFYEITNTVNPLSTF